MPPPLRRLGRVGARHVPRLNQAATTDDLSRWLDADILRRMWPVLWLPARLRALWQARFSELAAPPQGLAR